MARPQGTLFGLNLLEKKGAGKKLAEAWDYFQWRRNFAQRLTQYKDKHKGQDCFIIGNGPSLKHMDLAPLRERYTFGQNKIFLLFDKVDLDLSYLVSVNKLVIEQSAREFEAMKCPVFLSYTAAKGVVAEQPNIERLHTLNLWSFYEDISQPICEGNTVTYVSLQIAYYMGFKRVFLIGVDHSFKQSGQSHETQVYKGDDENHFHPDYFKGQQWQLADVYGSEVSYHLAYYFYQKDDRQIFDATPNGKLEVFPKLSFEEALKMSSRK